MSLQAELAKYLEYRPTEWINGGELERKAFEWEYKASNASRRLRELEKSGIILKRLNDKRCVEYKWNEANTITAQPKAPDKQAEERSGQGFQRVDTQARQESLLHLW